MKVILFSLLFLLCLHTFSQQQAPKPLRHFMQATPSPANAIPYGANAKAGRYANAGDARIYYEVYGKGKPIVVLHGGIVGSVFEMHEFLTAYLSATRSSPYPLVGMANRKWVPACLHTSERQRM